MGEGPRRWAPNYDRLINGGDINSPYKMEFFYKWIHANGLFYNHYCLQIGFINGLAGGYNHDYKSVIINLT